jgi:transposase
MLDGMEREEAARTVGFGVTTTYHWHNRYEEEGIDGLRDKPGRGRHRRLTEEQEASIADRGRCRCRGAAGRSGGISRG